MKTILSTFCLFALLAAPARAAFEDVDAGARATAMSGAYAAQTDGASSLFYNPAGIIGLTRYEAAISQEKMLMGLTDGSSLSRGGIAIGAPLVFGGSYWGAAAFGLDSLSLDSLYSESRMRLGYAYPVKDNLWVGLALARMGVTYGSDLYTAINPVLQSATGKSAMGIDIGAIYRLESMDLGLSIQNANEPDLGIKYPNKVDRKIGLGVAFKRETYTWDFDLVISGADLRLKTGAEIPLMAKKFNSRVQARGGFSLGSRDYRSASAGFGYNGGAYRVDYSFVYPLSGISGTMGSHQLGVVVAWGEPRGPLSLSKEKEEELKEEKALTSPVKPEEGPRTVATKGEIARAEKLLPEARNAMRRGAYAEATATFRKADELFISNMEVKEALTKIAAISVIMPEATGATEREDLVRKAVNRYADKNTDAMLYITYARQKWIKDTTVARLYNVIAREFPETAAGMRILPDITIIDQLLQDALDFIRTGRYIQAISTLQRVLQLEPNNIPALTRMGSAYWAMEKKDVARKNWERVIELDPNNKEVLQFMKMN
ncbi:MAG: type IX secretion system membrane protein PorP/SprF [Elusimicrobiota bacterium]|nr:type IX secretion system membrane protein PorP/SprF [Elusimicrobiota bacterium]